jgi:hypothetical protein
MTGTVLYPLNHMKELLPHVYETGVAKYRGREELMDTRIPVLGNCLWNDVLFLSAVCPSEVRKAYESVGGKPPKNHCFKIPIDSLDQSRMAVLTRMGMNMASEHDVYERFDPLRMQAYAQIPRITLLYWQQVLTQKQRPLYYLHIPHILYRGTIDVSNASVVDA